MRKIFVLLLILSAGCAAAPPHETLRWDCGPYPEHYEEMIREYVKNTLLHPESLRELTIYKKPERIKLDADYPLIPLLRGQWVWECFVLYDAKDKNQKYTGKTFHVIWIRQNHMVACDYNTIDLDYFVKTRVHEIKKSLK